MTGRNELDVNTILKEDHIRKSTFLTILQLLHLDLVTSPVLLLQAEERCVVITWQNDRDATQKQNISLLRLHRLCTTHLYISLFSSCSSDSYRFSFSGKQKYGSFYI